MKYRKFRWILFAMTVVLTGVISMQAYWLNKAVLLEKKKFADQVRGAMMAATAKIESGEAFNLIAENYLPPPPFPPGMEVRDCVITRRENGKLIHIVHNHTGPAIPLPPHAPPGTVMEFKIDDSVSEKNITVKKDSMNVVVLRGQRMKSAVKNALMQYVFTPDSAEQRTNRREVEKALTESFKNAGLPENFDFAVKKNTGNLSFLRDTSADLVNKLKETPFRAPLFPSDRNPKGDELLVSINDHHNLIIRELWPQFLISLLFTISLIVIFAMTFREALKQKKISEIRNDFINNMTHEFKTPIATISLAADTVMNEAVIHDPESVRKYSEIIKRENRRMNEQVEKVLELALTEKKELKLVYEPVDLNELLARLVSVMQLQVQSRNGKINFEKQEHAVMINGDEFHLEKIFLNLLDNAIKYSKEAPVINISLSPVNGHVIVEIKDNGIGIPADEQKRIFDRFYRIPTGDRHDVKGFGLGLSYVKSIMELHDGKIELESQPGKGSIFRLIFRQ
jgi:signal transduction histidine kinase